MSFQRKIIGICFILHFSVQINYSWYSYEDEQIMKIQWSYKHSKLLNGIKGDNLTKIRTLSQNSRRLYAKELYQEIEK